jgi:hypothetical protein
LALVIVAGINWLLVGLAHFDLVAAVLGGSQSAPSRVVYVIVGLSALWQIAPWIRTMTFDEPRAEPRHFR